MRLDFMTPDVWNGLVLGTVFVGLALAILRLYSDLSRPPRKKPKDDQLDTDRTEAMQQR